jgi:hypothetical protein
MLTACPHCGAEMEPIETESSAVPFRQLQLCPICYLVSFKDDTGEHLGQGVPVRNVEHRPPVVN